MENKEEELEKRDGEEEECTAQAAGSRSREMEVKDGLKGVGWQDDEKSEREEGGGLGHGGGGEKEGKELVDKEENTRSKGADGEKEFKGKEEKLEKG